MRREPCYNETEIGVMQPQAKECQGLMATFEVHACAQLPSHVQLFTAPWTVAY